LRKQHIEEALAVVIKAAKDFEDNKINADHHFKQAMWNLMGGKNLYEFIEPLKKQIINHCAGIEVLKKFICILILLIYVGVIQSERQMHAGRENDTSIY
jgi:hypothetical protein